MCINSYALYYLIIKTILNLNLLFTYYLFLIMKRNDKKLTRDITLAKKAFRTYDANQSRKAHDIKAKTQIEKQGQVEREGESNESISLSLTTTNAEEFHSGAPREIVKRERERSGYIWKMERNPFAARISCPSVYEKEKLTDNLFWCGLKVIL